MICMSVRHPQDTFEKHPRSTGEGTVTLDRVYHITRLNQVATPLIISTLYAVTKSTWTILSVPESCFRAS